MDLDTKQVISQIIAFLLMVWILKRFAWKPLLHVMEERRQHIKSEFSAIEQQKHEVATLEADYQSRLKEIDAEARSRLQEGVNEGRKISQEIQTKAREQARDILNKAEAEIKVEMEKAKIQLKNDVVNLTMLAAEKFLHSTLDAEKQKALIAEFIKEAQFK